MPPTQITLAAVLAQVAEGIRAQRFRVLMIGGFALPAYGVERLTLDIDFLMTDSDLGPVCAALEAVGYHRVLRTPQFARLQPEAKALPEIDLVFVEPNVIDAVWSSRTSHIWSGVELPVASVDIMLGTKLHALKHNREGRGHKSDMSDIRGLLEANEIDPAGDRFKGLCEKYGTLELWQELQK